MKATNDKREGKKIRSPGRFDFARGKVDLINLGIWRALMTCAGAISRSSGRLARSGAVSVALLLVVGCAIHPIAPAKEKFSAAALVGTHHMSADFNVVDFYVDDHSGSNVGREGGGGSLLCCVMLPWRWRPDLTVEVRWMVGDWSKEVPSLLAAGDYSSIAVEGIYLAKVPVEPYEETGNLYVHFFQVEQFG